MIIPSLFKRFLPRKLWQQIFLILLCLVVIPLVSIGTILIHTSQNALQRGIERNLQQITLHSTGEVFKEYEGTVKALTAASAILGTLNADPWRQETVAVELSLQFPAFRRISSINLDGNEIATSQLGTPMRSNISDEVFMCAKSGKQCVSDVRIAADHTPVMDIAVPVHHFGKVSGVLMAEYSLRGVWDIIDQIQFEPGGEVFLVDDRGRIIAHPDKKKVLQNAQFPYPTVIEDVLAGKSGSIMEADADKGSWMVAYAPVKGLQWGLVAAEPSAQAFMLIDVIRRHSWVVLILTLGAMMLVAFLLANRMSRPIEQLMEATRRLAHGDLDVSLPVRRRDEMGRLMFAFNNMTVQLREARHMEKLSIVGRSAAAIAHELKNSLTLVKTFMQLMPERAQDPAFVRESSETVLREMNSWNMLLQNMMDFSKVPMPLKLSLININSLVEDVTAMAKLKAHQYGVNFLVEVSPSMPAIEADREKIKQVLINLISNAFEATSQGGTIVVSTLFHNTESGGHLELRVSNSGEGITEENLNKVFDAFFTTKESGLGLGLTICREIVHRHGGRLEVRSRKGQGVVLMMKLPVYSVRVEEGKKYDFRENRRRG